MARLEDGQFHMWRWGSDDNFYYKQSIRGQDVLLPVTDVRDIRKHSCVTFVQFLNQCDRFI